MATISTTIRVNDQITSVIKNMSAALGASIHAFEQLQSASNNAVSTASIEAARRSLGALNGDIDRLEQNLQDSQNGQNGLNNSINQGRINMGGLVTAALGLVSAYVSLNGLKGALDLADTVASNTARLDLINDGLQTTEELQDKIFNASQRSLSSYQDTVKLVGALGSRARNAFSSNDETIQFAENLGKLFSIAGAGQQEQASATLQLTQALGSGVLRGEELNAVLEAAPNIVQKITEYLGASDTEVRKLATDGKLTADVIKNALLGATVDINEGFAALPTTFSDAFTVFRNNALRTFEGVLAQLTKISNSKGFQNFLYGLSQALSVVATLASHTISVLASVSTFVYENWYIIGPVIGAVGTALVVLGGILLATTTYTYAMAAAVAFMNSALLANPIVLVVLAIIALIGVFYIVIGLINQFTGTSVSATGIVAGVFAGLFSFIYNIFVTLYNLFGAVAEYFINVWLNPAYSLRLLFVNIAKAGLGMAESLIGSFDSAATNLANLFVGAANTAIGAINSIIGALNNIPGINIGEIGEISARTSITADYSKLRTKLDNFAGEKPANYLSVPKLQNSSIPDAVLGAYSAGSTLGGKFGGNGPGALGAADYGTGALGALDSLGKTADAAKKDGKKTADNTKKVADKVGMAADDLKYLRDLSERDAINRYTTASINLDVKNDLQVNSEIDIDGLIDRFGEKLEESVETVAAGGVVFNV